MLMCSCVMQEEKVSTGKPICGWHGLAESKEVKGLGEGRDKGGLMLLNCVQEAEFLRGPRVRAEKESRHCIRSPSINFTVHITNEKERVSC